MLQRFITVGLMGVVLGLTACDRMAQLQYLEQGSQVPPYSNATQRMSPGMSPGAENAIKDSATEGNASKAATETATAETAMDNTAANAVSSPPLEEAWLPKIQGSPSAQLKADLKEQARRAKQNRKQGGV
jgi:hypothetical protein